MSDPIDRQAAIKALNTEIIKRRLLDDVNDGALDEFDTESILRALPSAQPEPQWIPFAEHRPWEGQQILACSEDGVMWMTVFRSCIGFSGAWMPLPEPYKGEP